MKTEEIDTAAQTAEREPVNPADDARNDVAAAIKQLKGEADGNSSGAEPADATGNIDGQADAAAKSADSAAAEAKGDHPTDPRRFADGTFKPTKADAAPDKAAPEVIPSTDAAKVTDVSASTPALSPPAGWTAAEKAEWLKLSPAVQAAVSRREQEISRGGQQWSEEKQRYQTVLAPLVQETQKLGMSPEQGLNALLGAHRALQKNAPAAIAALAQQYGVDLATLASNPPAPQSQPQHDPMVSHLTQTVSALENQLNGFLQNQTLGVVEAFAQSHPHYAAVEGDLLNLIPMMQQVNPGATPQQILEKAYEQAIWSNPDVRAQLIAEQTANAQKANADALKAKEQKAVKAAVSIKGSSNGAMPPPKAAPSGGDVYDDVRAAINQLRQ